MSNYKLDTDTPMSHLDRLMEFAMACRDGSGYYLDYECLDVEGSPTIREAARTVLREISKT